MKRRNQFLLLVLVIAVTISSAPHFIAWAAPQVAQLQVTFESPADVPPQSWWQQLTGFLGIRSVGRIRPEIGTKLLVQASAYASSPYQTDSTPCITAAGTRVRPGVVATNFLPMGTILEIEGEKYIVEDRMNSRYAGYYLDVWLPSTSEALIFGRKGITITIVDYGKPGQEIREEEKKVVEPTPAPEKPGILKRVRGGVGTLTSGLADFIGARSPAELNKHDINCFEDDEKSE